MVELIEAGGIRLRAVAVRVVPSAGGVPAVLLRLLVLAFARGAMKNH